MRHYNLDGEILDLGNENNIENFSSNTFFDEIPKFRSSRITNPPTEEICNFSCPPGQEKICCPPNSKCIKQSGCYKTEGSIPPVRIPKQPVRNPKPPVRIPELPVRIPRPPVRNPRPPVKIPEIHLNEIHSKENNDIQTNEENGNQDEEPVEEQNEEIQYEETDILTVGQETIDTTTKFLVDFRAAIILIIFIAIAIFAVYSGP